MRTIFAAAALLVTSSTALIAQATPSGQGDVAAIIREYYGAPGNAVSIGDLPTGALRQLQVDALVPSELAKEMMPLPVDLTRRLPPVLRGQQRGRIGDRVLLIERTSQRILDVVVITARP